ncbi:MAG: DUF1887 family protein [Clostridiales bacterium]|nr:DUF1887 family protein [Clostridiales bacterium]
MVIPFAADNNDAVFGNVAAPAVVNPERIIYLYNIEKQKDADELIKTIPRVVEYMNKKHIRAAIEFILVYQDKGFDFSKDKIEEKMKQAGGSRIRQIKCMAMNDTVPENLEEYLKKRSSGKRFFAVENRKTGFFDNLNGASFYKSFNNYRFDSRNMEFSHMVGCDMLGYIKKNPYITVADIMALSLSSCERSNQPEFYDEYKELWKRYCDNTVLWKGLCDDLGKYAEANDTLATFDRKQKEKSEDQTYTYIMPFACKNNVDKIIKVLKDNRLLDNKSRVTAHTTDSCRVKIVDRYGYRKEYDKLFSKIYALMMPDQTVTVPVIKNNIEVKFENLEVKGFKIPDKMVETDAKKQNLQNIMTFLNDKGYVINLDLNIRDRKMSFTYATRAIKDLLTTSGRLLEIYTYHKAKECGRFDDLEYSLVVNWEDKGVKSEFDCILTKGFRSLFVECKARGEIQQEFYYRIARLTEKFGINATVVLIADTNEKPYYDSVKVNDMQRKRGDMLNVVTISDRNDIANIGLTLLRVINGKYTDQKK